ncbi:hypothetical protein O3M35_001275 [Rhynocoris fuscipes]|uniref:Uncharacterized protein n=1 Tax=Rhynocoris fuscipes TaxID=488301 RepID=A0AAW1DPN2_9HEMI
MYYSVYNPTCVERKFGNLAGKIGEKSIIPCWQNETKYAKRKLQKTRKSCINAGKSSVRKQQEGYNHVKNYGKLKCRKYCNYCNSTNSSQSECSLKFKYKRENNRLNDIDRYKSIMNNKLNEYKYKVSGKHLNGHVNIRFDDITDFETVENVNYVPRGKLRKFRSQVSVVDDDDKINFLYYGIDSEKSSCYVSNNSEHENAKLNLENSSNCLLQKENLKFNYSEKFINYDQISTCSKSIYINDKRIDRKNEEKPVENYLHNVVKTKRKFTTKIFGKLRKFTDMKHDLCERSAGESNVYENSKDINTSYLANNRLNPLRFDFIPEYNESNPLRTNLKILEEKFRKENDKREMVKNRCTDELHTKEIKENRFPSKDYVSFDEQKFFNDSKMEKKINFDRNLTSNLQDISKILKIVHNQHRNNCNFKRPTIIKKKCFSHKRKFHPAHSLFRKSTSNVSNININNFVDSKKMICWKNRLEMDLEKLGAEKSEIYLMKIKSISDQDENDGVYFVKPINAADQLSRRMKHSKNPAEKIKFNCSNGIQKTESKFYNDYSYFTASNRAVEAYWTCSCAESDHSLIKHKVDSEKQCGDIVKESRTCYCNFQEIVQKSEPVCSCYDDDCLTPMKEHKRFGTKETCRCDQTEEVYNRELPEEQDCCCYDDTLPKSTNSEPEILNDYHEPLQMRTVDSCHCSEKEQMKSKPYCYCSSAHPSESNYIDESIPIFTVKIDKSGNMVKQSCMCLPLNQTDESVQTTEVLCRKPQENKKVQTRHYDIYVNIRRKNEYAPVRNVICTRKKNETQTCLSSPPTTSSFDSLVKSLGEECDKCESKSTTIASECECYTPIQVRQMKQTQTVWSSNLDDSSVITHYQSKRECECNDRKPEPCPKKPVEETTGICICFEEQPPVREVNEDEPVKTSYPKMKPKSSCLCGEDEPVERSYQKIEPKSSCLCGEEEPVERSYQKIEPKSSCLCGEDELDERSYPNIQPKPSCLCGEKSYQKIEPKSSCLCGEGEPVERSYQKIEPKSSCLCGEEEPVERSYQKIEPKSSCLCGEGEPVERSYQKIEPKSSCLCGEGEPVERSYQKIEPKSSCLCGEEEPVERSYQKIEPKSSCLCGEGEPVERSYQKIEPKSSCLCGEDELDERSYPNMEPKSGCLCGEKSYPKIEPKSSCLCGEEEPVVRSGPKSEPKSSCCCWNDESGERSSTKSEPVERSALKMEPKSSCLCGEEEPVVRICPKYEPKSSCLCGEEEPVVKSYPKTEPKSSCLCGEDGPVVRICPKYEPKSSCLCGEEEPVVKSYPKTEPKSSCLCGEDGPDLRICPKYEPKSSCLCGEEEPVVKSYPETEPKSSCCCLNNGSGERSSTRSEPLDRSPRTEPKSSCLCGEEEPVEKSYPKTEPKSSCCCWNDESGERTSTRSEAVKRSPKTEPKSSCACWEEEPVEKSYPKTEPKSSCCCWNDESGERTSTKSEAVKKSPKTEPKSRCLCGEEEPVEKSYPKQTRTTEVSRMKTSCTCWPSTSDNSARNPPQAATNRTESNKRKLFLFRTSVPDAEYPGIYSSLEKLPTKSPLSYKLQKNFQSQNISYSSLKEIKEISAKCNKITNFPEANIQHKDTNTFEEDLISLGKIKPNTVDENETNEIEKGVQIDGNVAEPDMISPITPVLSDYLSDTEMRTLIPISVARKENYSSGLTYQKSCTASGIRTIIPLRHTLQPAFTVSDPENAGKVEKITTKIPSPLYSSYQTMNTETTDHTSTGKLYASKVETVTSKVTSQDSSTKEIIKPKVAVPIYSSSHKSDDTSIKKLIKITDIKNKSTRNESLNSKSGNLNRLLKCKPTSTSNGLSSNDRIQKKSMIVNAKQNVTVPKNTNTRSKTGNTETMISKPPVRRLNIVNTKDNLAKFTGTKLKPSEDINRSRIKKTISIPGCTEQDNDNTKKRNIDFDKIKKPLISNRVVSEQNQKDNSITTLQNEKYTYTKEILTNNSDDFGKNNMKKRYLVTLKIKHNVSKKDISKSDEFLQVNNEMFKNSIQKSINYYRIPKKGTSLDDLKQNKNSSISSDIEKENLLISKLNLKENSDKINKDKNSYWWDNSAINIVDKSDIVLKSLEKKQCDNNNENSKTNHVKLNENTRVSNENFSSTLSQESKCKKVNISNSMVIVSNYICKPEKSSEYCYDIVTNSANVLIFNEEIGGNGKENENYEGKIELNDGVKQLTAE